MPRPPRIPANYSRTPHTHACTLNTHARIACTPRTYAMHPCMHATDATLCTPSVACVRGVHGIRVCVVCMRGMRAWLTCVACMRTCGVCMTGVHQACVVGMSVCFITIFNMNPVSTFKSACTVPSRAHTHTHDRAREKILFKNLLYLARIR